MITATDGSGNSTTLPIAIQPVIVGLQYTKLTMLAGMPGYQIPAWVNGSTNQTVNWTVASGPGSVTTGGVYTPPATVSAPSSVVLTATASADPTATATLWINVIPPGTNPTNSIRIDVGNTTAPYTDSQGNVWMTDTLGFETGGYSQQNDNYPAGTWGTAVDQTLFQTFNYTWGDDIFYGPFIVPNGNYKVGFGLAKGNCTTYSETDVWDDGLIWGPVDLEAQGQIGAHFDLGKAVNYACRVPYTEYVPAQVTNNLLYVAVRATGGGGSHSAPFLNALSIQPDTTTPYLAIDSQQVTSVAAGAVIQLYAVGWYMSNSVSWSVTGGGSIDQTGLYTAPATVSANQTVTIKATSTTNSGISATFNLTVTP